MLVRILGYVLNEKKELFISLTCIFGIGKSKANKICSELNLNPSIRVKELSNKDVNLLNDHIYKNYLIGDDLKKEIRNNISRLINSGSFRGKRLKNGLPCNGQNTRSNGKTARSLNSSRAKI